MMTECPYCHTDSLSLYGYDENGALYQCLLCDRIFLDEDEQDNEFHGDDPGYEWRKREDGY